MDCSSILVKIDFVQRRNRIRNIINEEDDFIARENSKMTQSLNSRKLWLIEYKNRTRKQNDKLNERNKEVIDNQNCQLNCDKVRTCRHQYDLAERLEDWKKFEVIKKCIKEDEKSIINISETKMMEEYVPSQREKPYLMNISDNEIKENSEYRTFNYIPANKKGKISKVQYIFRETKPNTVCSDGQVKEDVNKCCNKILKNKNICLNADNNIVDCSHRITKFIKPISNKNTIFHKYLKKRGHAKCLKQFFDKNIIKNEESKMQNKIFNDTVRLAQKDKNKKCEYNKKFNNQKFNGLINSVTTVFENHLDEIEKKDLYSINISKKVTKPCL